MEEPSQEEQPDDHEDELGCDHRHLAPSCWVCGLLVDIARAPCNVLVNHVFGLETETLALLCCGSCMCDMYYVICDVL